MTMLFMLAGAVVLIPVVVFVAMEAHWRHRWPEQVVHHQSADDVGHGVFRMATVSSSWTESLHGSAPLGVRLAALTCFFEGMSLLVSAPVWLFGLLVASDHHESSKFWLNLLLATFPPGAISAVLMTRAGLALLRGDHAPADRATRRASAFAVTLNLVLMAVSALAMLVVRSHSQVEGLVVPLLYAPVSIAQAVFTRWMFVKHARHFDRAAIDLDAAESPDSEHVAPSQPVGASS